MPKKPFDEVSLQCLRCSKNFPSDVPARSLLCPDCQATEKPRPRAFYKIYCLSTNLGQRFLVRKETAVFGMTYTEDMETFSTLEEARFSVPPGKQKTTKKSDIEYNLVETWF